MFIEILIPLVVSLASIQSEPDTSLSYPLNIKKRDAQIDEAVFLTQYFDRGELISAKEKSVVSSSLFLGVESYSGYLTVNKTYNSNLFFWYFPFNNEESSPWIIWLNGGPGSSSMFGLFAENGPFTIVDASSSNPLQRNKFSWCRNHSMVYIDSPVGTGFSFTDHEEGYARDMETYSLHLKLAVGQLLQIFPALKVAPLYVAGESYGGKYAPALAMELHNAQKQGLQVNLKGIITGNGFVDASTMAEVPQAFFHAGLISKEDIENFRPLKEAFLEDIRANRSAEAAKKQLAILQGCYGLTNFNPYNINSLDENFADDYGEYSKFLEREDVRSAIHVGNIKHAGLNGNNHTVHAELAGEYLTSARPLYEELLNNNYRVLAYCGMADMMIPCYLESEEYRRWKWSKSADFINATRNVLHFRQFNGARIGYYKTGGGLTEVQLRKAGHFVPFDLPRPIQEVVADWTNHVSLEQKLVPINYVVPYP